MATVAERLAVLEALVLPVDPPASPAKPAPVASVTVGNVTITSTTGTKADLEALIATKAKG